MQGQNHLKGACFLSNGETLKAELTHVLIRIRSQNMPETIGFIREKFKDVLPGYSADYQFVDERIDDIYKSEQRTKEIGIRRVLGASGSSIVWLPFSGTAKWMLAANLTAWLAAYLVIRCWLQS